MDLQNGIDRTPKGLTFLTEWGSLRHASGAAAIIAFYSRYVRKQDRKRSQQMLQFAENQVRINKEIVH